ncbi:MAG: hypothetical protein QG635_333 [Bacteroidota bacterium]|nr:hypothetical protein [Bacteroidota bacterium]
MYHTIDEFTKDWSEETANTAKILEALTDESLNTKVHDNVRTLGRLGWHIALTLGEMGEKTGLKVDCPPEDAPLPASAAAIADTYKKASASMLEDIKADWTDEMLAEEIELYGQKWTRGFSLSGLLKHELHHRAQMTVIMRILGLSVPGLYGPSKEEWAAYGMSAPE